MNDAHKLELKTKYPLLFENLPAGEVSCGDGWYDILRCLCHTIQSHIDSRKRQHDWLISRGDTPTNNLVPQVRIQQIKEKFGTLRFYFNGGDEYIYGAAQVAEHLSSRICEDCGARGKLRDGSWIRTLCDHCEEKHLARD